MVCVTRPSGTARATGEHQYGVAPLARRETDSVGAAAPPKLALVEPAGAQVAEVKVAGLEVGRLESAEAKVAELEAAGPEVGRLDAAGLQVAALEVGRLEFAEIEFAVIDLETTGWSPRAAAITEIAAVRARLEKNATDRCAMGDRAAIAGLRANCESFCAVEVDLASLRRVYAGHPLHPISS